MCLPIFSSNSRRRSEMSKKLNRSARALAPPAKFSYSAGAANHLPRFRVKNQELLQLGVFLVIKVASPHPLKRSRLDEREHETMLRLWRSSVNVRATPHRIPKHKTPRRRNSFAVATPLPAAS